MALLTIINTGHPAVTATLELWNQRKAELAAHIGGCQTCTRQPPTRYRTCKAGRSLATAMVAARTALINADAAVSAAARRT